MVFLLELNMVSGLFFILFVILGVFELKLRRIKNSDFNFDIKIMGKSYWKKGYEIEIL